VGRGHVFSWSGPCLQCGRAMSSACVFGVFSLGILCLQWDRAMSSACVSGVFSLGILCLQWDRAMSSVCVSGVFSLGVLCLQWDRAMSSVWVSPGGTANVTFESRGRTLNCPRDVRVPGFTLTSESLRGTAHVRFESLL
jgi:hypothetical protein